MYILAIIMSVMLLIKYYDYASSKIYLETIAFFLLACLAVLVNLGLISYRAKRDNYKVKLIYQITLVQIFVWFAILEMMGIGGLYIYVNPFTNLNMVLSWIFTLFICLYIYYKEQKKYNLILIYTISFIYNNKKDEKNARNK